MTLIGWVFTVLLVGLLIYGLWWIVRDSFASRRTDRTGTRQRAEVMDDDARSGEPAPDEPVRRLHADLRGEYVSVFEAMGVPSTEAKRIFEVFFSQVIDEATAQGSIGLPRDAGSRLLAMEKHDPSVREMLAAKRSDGVRDQDILWWWGLHDVERRLIKKMDDWFRGATFIKSREEGLSEEAAATKVRSCYPMYGDPRDEQHSSGENRPLPDELHDRINRFSSSLSPHGLVELSAEVEMTGSMNAAIRARVRKNLI